jgi:epoxyqueuosine reductase
VSRAKENSATIKALANQAGFSFCGIARVRRLDEEESTLSRWLKMGYAGKMNYMHNHFDMRLDPGLLVPGAKSIICLASNYYPAREQEPDAPQIARYAYGSDYHQVLRKKMKGLFEAMIQTFGQIQGRVFVDSAPILERQWAAIAGLGWIGKNGLVLRKNTGSYFFLSEIICDLDLEPDEPASDHCGTCTACIDACPTDAIVDRQLLDASRCISYLTIELREKIPDEFRQSMENRVFGCDICQEVCPWNRFSKAHHEPAFNPDERLLGWTKQEWHEMTRELFEDLFGKSAVKRAGFDGFIRNLKFIDSGS